jgi:hypothetical protein
MTAPPPEDENEKVSDDINVSEMGSRNKTMRITYRITPAEYQTMTRIADLVFKNGSIKINSPSALARAATFTHLNIFLQAEAKENAYKAKEAIITYRRSY